MLFVGNLKLLNTGAGAAPSRKSSNHPSAEPTSDAANTSFIFRPAKSGIEQTVQQKALTVDTESQSPPSFPPISCCVSGAISGNVSANVSDREGRRNKNLQCVS